MNTLLSQMASFAKRHCDILALLFFVVIVGIFFYQTILIVSQPILAGIFLYLFLRRKNLEPVPSLLGALCFSFSGFSIAWLTWGTMLSTWLWTPLSLIAIDEIINGNSRKSIRWVVLL